MEQNYDFRKRLLQLHRPNLRDADYVPQDGTVALTDQFRIVISPSAGRVIRTAAKDFQDYLLVSMGISVPLVIADAQSDSAPVVSVRVQPENGPLSVSASYCIRTGPSHIEILGADERGCAQALYQLEDQMTLRRAPYLTSGEHTFAPAFSPRMIHSGYGMDQFPDEHLAAIARRGMDAILVFVKDVDQTPAGYLCFHDLIWRAAGYGLDVYAYSYFTSEMHPDDDGAEAHYESTYGNLFRQCPGLKGVVLVGESVEFPSKDPRVSKFKYYNNTIDGLPTGKPTAGWFPCCDYYKWVNMLKTVIRRHQPDADIVFWTYNWASKPEEDRLALIDSLPTDISLMATFEMFDHHWVNGLKIRPADYTISFPGPSPYFLSEAKRAKQRGIRLYTQANSAGLTWDFGVIPYEPFPMQWAKRYNAMLDAHDKYGLCGVMESHHFGYWPSFISELEKLMFTEPRMAADEAIRLLAVEYYGPALADAGMAAWRTLSEAITFYPCCDEDQYGPFRIGPAYPLVLMRDVQIPTVPYAHFGGNKICFTNYGCDYLYAITSAYKTIGMPSQRISGELRCLEDMLRLLRQGREQLEAIAPKLSGVRADDCRTLCNQLHFMEHCIITTMHVKQFAIRKWKLRAEQDVPVMEQLLTEMTDIARKEIENAEQTIPLVEADSRLGWEPSMEYIGDARHIRWKIRQVTQLIEQELPEYRKVIHAQDANPN